jgi:hypothetical protein
MGPYSYLNLDGDGAPRTQETSRCLENGTLHFGAVPIQEVFQAEGLEKAGQRL